MARHPALVCALVVVAALAFASGQRITTIQLDGVQYFVSRMNPYSPELNYFLAYQYCRSLGLQLTSFESKEKSDSITQYLRNAGYNQYDFWTSGNRLGTDMFLWMSTGLPFNATFDLMNQAADGEAAPPGPQDAVVMTSEQPAPLLRRPGSARQSKSGPSSGCVALKAPDLRWSVDDCTSVKDFICEQTRCYYYNYGSIPVSSSQGRNNRDKPVPATSTTTTSTTTTTTTPVPTIAPAPTTEAIDLRQDDASDGNEVPAEEASADVASDVASDPAASTSPPAIAEEVPEEAQPDNSVLAGTEPPPQPTDLPAAPARARGKFLEQPAAPGIGWGWPANIKLEIPVPRRVSGVATVN
ncbi:melanoma-associated antigen E1 isoform X1 [Frankliniella occidentalis]|uniref:Melanoma-associated antigen E1 isoform X1 n=2 Tax=Frankliniella occidentalis TaxID=133901 RepID=A0A6J1S624_FRAOC|nr:melanoma-associated antigen E1 isoform X1 [Frankliniella occidentalis]